MTSKKHKEAMDYIYNREADDMCASRLLTREELIKWMSESVVACCIHPPSSDGSRCCGGTCACDEEKNYICEKCKVGD